MSETCEVLQVDRAAAVNVAVLSVEVVRCCGAEDMVAAPAGFRAQAVTREGGLVDDFVVIESENMVNINNAPSPAATASLNVGKLIVEKLENRLQT